MKNRFQPLFDIDHGHGGAGGGMTTEEFQRKTLDAVGAVKNQVQNIETKFTEIDKDSKKLADDFGKHVKSFEGLPSQVADVSRTIQQIQLRIAQERRSSFGSGLERIAADEQCRNAVNGMIRMAARRSNPNVPITEAQEKAAQDYIRAMVTGSGSGASYINAQLIPDIYSVVAEYGMWNRFDVVPVSTTSAKLIVDSTDPTMAWTAENTASSETSYTSANVTATIGKLLGWIQVSNELLADSEIDLVGHVLRKFANATAYALDFACTSADGGADATDGGYTGIFGGSGTAAVAAGGNVSVATLDLEDFLAAMLAVDASVLSKPTAAWVLHPQMLVRILSVKDSNGRPIFLPSTDAPALGGLGSILGYPVVLCHTANATDGTSKRIAVFGDLQGQAVCLRSDFEFAASDQVKFTEDSTVFRARARGAAKTKRAQSFGVLTTAAS
jgi:HK97 family phage major capsid protein